jgi:uncharacterized membrane protein YgaE (UPF0421/DUF939 family)
LGIRVIKTALAAVVAIYLAYLLQLDYWLSAGLLAIITIEVTRKKSLRSALVRLSASIVGLMIALLIFAVLGFHIWVIALYILITYPVLAKLKLHDGIVTSSVPLFHIFYAQSIAVPLVWNEFVLLVVGLGSAMVFNLLYMPSWERELHMQKYDLEQQMSRIFIEIAKHLRDPVHIWNGLELIQADEAIQKGKMYASRVSENAIFHAEQEWIIYFEMRARQLEMIQHMLVILARVYEQLPHGEMAAQLFDTLSEDVKNLYYTGVVEEQLKSLEMTYEAMPLPQTRAEFATRAAILQICLDLGHYLSIAKEKKQKAPLKVS